MGKRAGRWGGGVDQRQDRRMMFRGGGDAEEDEKVEERRWKGKEGVSCGEVEEVSTPEALKGWWELSDSIEVFRGSGWKMINGSNIKSSFGSQGLGALQPLVTGWSSLMVSRTSSVMRISMSAETWVVMV